MKRVIIALVIFAFLFGGFLLWWKNGLLPVDPNDKSEKIFVVHRGSGLKEIASDLGKQGFIRNPIVFFLFTRQQKFEGKIQSGDFRLSPSMDAEKIAKELTHGTIDVWITIPEGKRAEEIAEIFRINIPNYNPSWITDLNNNEGYLFPDTYLIPKDTNINLIISIMKKNFENKYSSIPNAPRDNPAKGKTVIIASMIEREAKLAQDRPIVASVILNRLSIDMPLQIDATIQYALGYQEDKKTWWKKELSKSDLGLNTLYNTYTHTGLPPASISNPGLNTLKAVVNPAKTDYLYYVSDKFGRNHYAKTLDEHNANIRKYGL